MERKTSLFIQAEKLRMSQRYEEAIPAYEAVLVEDPSDLDVRRTLAGLYLLQQDPKRVPIGYMLLATCLLAQGKVDQASALVDRIRGLDPAGRLESRLGALVAQIDAARAATPAVEPEPVEIVEEQTVIVEESGEIHFVDVPAEPPPDESQREPPEMELSANDGIELERMERGEPPSKVGAPPEEDAIDLGPATEELPAIEMDESGEIPLPSDTAMLRPVAPLPEEVEVAGDVTGDDLDEIASLAQREAEDATRSLARLSTALFRHLPPAALSELIQACQVVRFPTGASIFLEGSESDSVLLLSDGRVQCSSARTEDGARAVVGSFGPGELLGLMAFLTSDTQDVDVTAIADATCYRLAYDDLERLMADHTEFGMAIIELYKEHVISLFMATSRILSSLPAEAQAALVRAFELFRAQQDEVIIREGTPGDDLFFIKQGGVKVVTVRGGATIELARMGKHEFFGEISFLTGGKRSASVVATMPTELLRVDGEKMWYIADGYPAVREILKDVQTQHISEAMRKLSGLT